MPVPQWLFKILAEVCQRYGSILNVDEPDGLRESVTYSFDTHATLPVELFQQVFTSTVSSPAPAVSSVGSSSVSVLCHDSVVGEHVAMPHSSDDVPVSV